MQNYLKKTGFLSALGAVFYWLALPPLQCPWAAYLSVAFWVALVAKQPPLTKKEFRGIWLTALFMWLALLQGVRLAFWPMYAGWMALSMYLALYLPLFIFIARSLRHSIKFPLSIACAIAWIVCEWVRAHFLTGFSTALLAHSQAPWPWSLQIAAHLGSYGVSFFVVLGGSLVYECYAFTADKLVKSRRSETRSLNNSPFSCVLLASFVLVIWRCSSWSLAEYDRLLLDRAPSNPLAHILLIQDDVPIYFDSNGKNLQEGWLRYEQQTSLAAKNNASSNIDLVVWPESTFSAGVPWLDWDGNPEAPKDFDGDSSKFRAVTQSIEASMKDKLHRIFLKFGAVKPQFILGSDVVKVHSGTTTTYNAAIWARTDNLRDSTYYAKQHLVMFGEYIPLVSHFPLLLKWLGLGKYEPGTEPVTWILPNGVKISPSICFENVLPQLVRSHVHQLSLKGVTPDLLINITNDGWFRGSTILDHHLNSAIFTAAENRRPMLIAGNQGISAWIDSTGRVVRSLGPLASGFILAEPIADGRWGLWQAIGDLPEVLLTILCAIVVLRDLFMRRI